MSRTQTLSIGQVAATRRAIDYLVLTKPRLVTLVLVTTLVGFYAGSTGRVDLPLLVNTILGTALAAGGALALNQYLERELDGRMARTRQRPLPDGRLAPFEALAFGVATTAAGLTILTILVNPLVGAVEAVTVATYLFVYTPLKTRTSLATIAGAVPGALPPVAGWVAARGSFGAGAAALFAILFLWQLPHFLALAWMYREDYRIGQFAYVVNSSGVQRFTISATTGALTAAGSPVAAGTTPVSINVDASGQFAYVANAGGVSRFTIDAGTGVLTAVGGPTAAGTTPSSVTTTGTVQ